MTDRRNDDRDGLNPTLASTPPTQREIEVQDTQLQGVIELREERLIVHKEREVAGGVALTREVRRETVQVPVELVTEVLVVEHLGSGTEGGHAITLDGTPLAPGERRELLVYREEAQVEKRVVVSEQVKISKRQVVETRTFDATLAREELVVDPQGDVEVTERPPEALDR